MKVLQLNTWTGRMKGALTRFFEENNFDIVCLQEAVWSKEAPDHLAHFVDTADLIKEASGLKYDTRVSNYGIELLGGNATMEQGNVILSRYKILKYEPIEICGTYSNKMNFTNRYGSAADQGYFAQKIELENGLVVVNYHGYWLTNPLGDKMTVKCMKKVADTIRNEKRPTIMCGDLNVIAEAPAMRELDFLTNLTEVNNIKTTLMNLKFVKDVACDHILLTPGLKWQNFKVDTDRLVSDHAALSVEVSL